MKTKIIYISGNELFDITDIRAAFEEVRTALSLGNDTVLFGVPVDSDDALPASQPTIEPVATNLKNDDIPVVNDVKTETEQDIEPEKPARRTRKQAKVVPITPVATESEPQPEVPAQPETEVKIAPVVPILSVLGSKSPDDSDDDIYDVIDDTPSDTNDVAENTDIDTEHVTITDMIADDVPVQNTEKTLEELLESMTPLGEDTAKSDEPISVDVPEPPVTKEPVATSQTDDIDMTLEKLATEFVENQDKIGTPAKPATRGKIGKLKNILPFKKAKHDDSGLMGDLFGWAGVAANDEDFTIPGFFK